MTGEASAPTTSSATPRVSRRALALSAVALITGVVAISTAAASGIRAAQGTSECSAAYTVDKTLQSGARWQLCWEPRDLEGVILRDVKYAPPGGQLRRVLGQANMAELHVPYYNNVARYHDLTGIGLTPVKLQDDNCPGGEVKHHSYPSWDPTQPPEDRGILCVHEIDAGAATRYVKTDNSDPNVPVETLFTSTRSQLELWFSTQLGAYNYSIAYRLVDNGVFEMAMSAAGSLQMTGPTADGPVGNGSNGTGAGWPLGGTDSHVGIGHNHNFMVRLDVDLGDAGGDRVEKLTAPPSADHLNRIATRTAVPTEAAVDRDGENFATWRVYDPTTPNEDGHPISYELDTDSGHTFRGTDTETFTHHDLFITANKPCERLATNNRSVEPACADAVDGYVNGESLDGGDPVLWYLVTFNHLPRDEDEPYMDQHTSTIRLVPRDVFAENAPELGRASTSTSSTTTSTTPSTTTGPTTTGPTTTEPSTTEPTTTEPSTTAPTSTTGPTTTAAPTTTVPPTTAQPTTAPPPKPTEPAPGARTGANVAWLAAGGGLILAAGIGLLAASRRSRSQRRTPE